MSIKEQATRSVFWSAIERFSVQGIQFVLTIIIARVLSPDDYGLVAMLGIFLALAQVLIDSGFANALIQKQERTETDFNTVFYFNAIGGVLIYILLYFAAPFIAHFFEEPPLTLITRVLCLNLVIMSFGIVQQAKLTISLDFQRQAKATLLAVVLSGVLGLWMAYNDYGVWTLVFQSIANNFLRVLFLWLFSRWMPRWQFSFQSFRSLFSFGSKLMLTGLMHQLYTNMYSLVIGKVFSPTDLGYFNRAYTIAQFPSSNLSSVVVRAIYPIQCRIQDDMDQLRSTFMKYMRVTCYVIFPLMIALVALAEPLVKVMLTDKWLPVVPYLRLLSLAFMWDPIMKINNTILSVKGRTDYSLKSEIVKKIIALLLLVVSIPFGVWAMCVSLILYAWADMGVIVYYSRKITNVGYVQQLLELLPVLLLNVVVGVAMYLFTLMPLSAWGQIAVAMFGGCGLYILISHAFKMPEWLLLLSMLKLNRKR